MNKFAIVTDLAADMPREFFEENNIDIATMPFTLNGVEYGRDNLMSHDEFYIAIRNGAVPKTSQTDMEDVKAIMDKHLKEGEDVLYLSFSSGVSGSFDNINNIVRKEMKEEYPDRKIIVIDSLSGCGGQGLLLYKAVKMRSEGKSIEEVADFLENNKLKVNHYYVIGDLDLLRKGGRISKTQAMLGNIIGIKPILMLDSKGKNYAVGKARGKKKAISTLMDLTKEGIIPEENDFIMTTHCNCIDDVNELNKELEKEFGKPIITVPLSYLVGAHVGPDTIGVFFFGKERKA